MYNVLRTQPSIIIHSHPFLSCSRPLLLPTPCIYMAQHETFRWSSTPLCAIVYQSRNNPETIPKHYFLPLCRLFARKSTPHPCIRSSPSTCKDHDKTVLRFFHARYFLCAFFNSHQILPPLFSCVRRSVSMRYHVLETCWYALGNEDATHTRTHLYTRARRVLLMRIYQCC